LLGRLHEALVVLEQEIEATLRHAEELLQQNSDNDRHQKEEIAIQKSLMEDLTQYDAIAKQLQKLPCTNGPASSQDRIQKAIVTRARLFLQKSISAFKSLPTPQRSNTETNHGKDAIEDMDAKTALALQPLLEQEALLETFVEEALAQRKFEDVKTLKSNLAEIRAEIEKMAFG